MFFIVGLGNPGPSYCETRHNMGFLVIEELARRLRIRLRTMKWESQFGQRVMRNSEIVLFKPLTFMNLSGNAVKAFMQNNKVNLAELILIYDDLDTEIGKVRLRYKGSSGGHNGLSSVIEQLGTEEFKRVRVGISRPESGVSVINYVLSPFEKDEQEKMRDGVTKGADAIEHALVHSFEKTMAVFNRKD